MLRIRTWSPILTLILVVVIATTLAQYFIAKRQKPILGWILPSVSLLAISPALIMLFYDGFINTDPLAFFDTYTTVALLFVPAWLLSVYFACYYRTKFKTLKVGEMPGSHTIPIQ